MKKSKLLLAILFVASYMAQAQVSFPSQKQTDDGKPLYEMEFSPRLKLNGYVNLGGNDMNSQSINLNSANPYNPLTEKNMDFNMYQTQLAWKTTYNGFAKGPLVAYVDYNHWHIGQGCTFFGYGVASWYNTLDWEGTNSGTWARHVQVTYYNNF